MGEIVGALIVTHTPRIANEAAAPDFTREMIRGMHELADVVARVRPDVLIQSSTHWVTTFNHYVLSHKRHKGILTSSEAPEIIAGMPYDFPGDAEMAEAIAAQANAAGVPAIASSAEPFMLEYGTVNPVQYLTPKFDVPVVPVSCCLLADLQECLRFGEAVGAAVRGSSRRAVVVASGALSHKLVRGPVDLADRGKSKARPSVHRHGDARPSGRDQRVFSFVLQNDASRDGRPPRRDASGRHRGIFKGKLHAYGPSSGTGNPVVSLLPA
jgi:3,4-dihydroxyphenylacetate 2,3-dioxygenase